MRYLVIIRVGDDGMPAGGPGPELVADMGRFVEESRKAGVLLETGGLAPLEQASRVRLAGGRVSVLDGPFAEAREVVGGFALLEVPSRAAAVDWASRMLGLHGPEWRVEIELREIAEAP